MQEGGANGSCDVNVKYELLQTYLELQEVTISIPLPWVTML